MPLRLDAREPGFPDSFARLLGQKLEISPDID